MKLYRIYISAFFFYLAAPLLVVALFAFNDSNFTGLPWKGFTLDWFIGKTAQGRTGLFHDSALISGFWTSIQVAFWVSLISVSTGLLTAILFERFRFPGQSLLYVIMLLPLVIPGVILGIGQLVLSSHIANTLSDKWGWEADLLRPGIPLIILGQASFITTLCTLVIGARLRKFNRQFEEAALNLGAQPVTVWRTVILPWLMPAITGAYIMAWLMSFENFNTTLMLTGSDAPLTVVLFNRLREGSTPVLNAVSVTLMVGSGALAMLTILSRRTQP